jgi:hexosaminidase
MHLKKTLAILVFISFLLNCKNQPDESLNTQIIPLPSTQIITEGVYILNNDTGIQFEEDFKIAARFLKSFIEEGSSISIKDSATSLNIVFIKDKTISNNEGYTLNITPNRITIKANTDQGAFYAVQSLRQLLPPEFENGSYSKSDVSIKCLEITDEPQFVYRGMHLDVGRHMFSVDFIKKYINAIAMLKMNTFHWHLTEDQGWRIEIKKNPKLQDIAAFRDETLIGHYRDQPHQFDGKRYGGFYTQEQIKDVVAYAQERHVTIIPEIEMPGHSQAAIAAYPELGCAGEQINVATKWGVFEDVYCPKESTFKFLESVLDEVMTLFPSKYIHIGGDEAPKTRWKNCKHCQKLIKKEGLKDEHELQNYFISRMEKYLNSKGRQIIGWDEILEGGLAPNATVMSWRGTKGAVEAAKQHHNVILTPGTHCYFDHYQSDNENEPLAIGGLLTLEKVHSFNPIPEELTKDEHQYVLGAQGNLWTEYIDTPEKAEYMAFPRAIALSEVVWSKPEQRDYTNFVSRLEQFQKRFDALDINYANHLYDVKGEVNTTSNGVFYTLKSSINNKTIRFTLDGSDPNLHSKIHEEPISITKSATLKAAIFNTDKQLGTAFTQKIDFHKGIGKKISLSVEPHESYSGSGANGLINGVSGSNSRFGDKEWLGFWGENIEITIDLGKKTEINSIETRFFNSNGAWIYAPDLIEILAEGELNKTGLQMKSLPYELILPIWNKNPSLKYFKKDFAFDNKILINSKVRYIKIKVPNYGIIPEGKPGAGNKAWTFIDEIIVN